MDLYTALDEKGQAGAQSRAGKLRGRVRPEHRGGRIAAQGRRQAEAQVKDSGASISAKGEKAEAADVSKDEMSSVVDALAKAVKNGDASLKGRRRQEAAGGRQGQRRGQPQYGRRGQGRGRGQGGGGRAGG